MGAAHRVEFEYESWGLDYVFRAYDSDRVEIRFLGIRLVKRLETLNSGRNLLGTLIESVGSLGMEK